MIRFLLGSVSVAAVLVAGVGAPLAQDVPSGYSIFLEGGPLFAAPVSFVGGDEDQTVSRPHGWGLNGSIGFGVPIDDVWDFRGFASAGMIRGNDETVTYAPIGGPGSYFGTGSGGTSALTNDFDFAALDLEFGQHSSLSDSDVDVRMFAGVRGLRTHDTTNVDLSAAPALGGPDHAGILMLDSEFWGVGPRVGIDMATKDPASQFGVSGSLAGSALGGILTSTNSMATVCCSSAPLAEWTPPASGSSFAGVLTLEGALGIDYHVGDTSVVTLGYKADVFMNIRSAPGLLTSDHQIVHGPFAKFAGNY